MRGRIGIVVAAGFSLFAGACSCSGEAEDTDATAAIRPEPKRHTDHATFFREPFADGPAVTRACLECHPDAATELMATQHWNWLGDEVKEPGHEKPVRMGKKNLLNNFCIGVQSNWAACTSCHAGYGWKDADFDFTDRSLVDCLVCHDNSGTYQKKAKGAGLPDPSVDLLASARSVGRPTRANCGSCHFSGGGGNAVKHGDLDRTLLNPSARVDVHMGREDFSCADCHRTRDHVIPGRSMSVSIDAANRVRCTECHAAKPHADARLDTHVERVACQSCHVPFIAVDEPTKMSWDWSQAGQDLGDDPHEYLKIKGRFVYARRAIPEYAWYDETSTRHLPGDRIDPSVPTKMNAPVGSKDDPKSRLWPFKVHRGRQVYDARNLYFLVPQTAGPGGYWTTFDWDGALRAGSQASGLAYSGEYAFAPTEMYWPLSHMVAPRESALQCADCHGERGRLDWKALGYPRDPLVRGALEHDPVVPLGADGQPVAKTGRPMSTAATCDECHDRTEEDFVAAHGWHARVRTDALEPDRRALMTLGPRIVDGEESNCLLCHARAPDLEARNDAITAEDPLWSIAATVPSLVTKSVDGYAWDKSSFDAEGAVDLGLSRVSDGACDACHGLAAPPPVALTLAATRGRTRTTGEVFSPERLRASGMNLAGKDALSLAWDVHAERQVRCAECHYSAKKPKRLEGDTPQQAHGEPRRCDSCHDTTKLHAWLPERDVHAKKVACESCHVPSLRLGAEEAIDRTVVLADGSPRTTWRGVLEGDPSAPASHAYLGGYVPVLLPRGRGDATKLAPHNLVTTWRWIDASGAPVPDATVRAAWLDGGTHRRELVAALDTDADGKLDDVELRLDTPARAAILADRLKALGVAGPRISGEIRPIAVHHGTAQGRWANRDCTSCHPAGDADRRSFELAPYVPGGVRPTSRDADALLAGAFTIDAGGALRFTPERKTATRAQRRAARESR